jgi:hypothetical protein
MYCISLCQQRLQHTVHLLHSCRNLSTFKHKPLVMKILCRLLVLLSAAAIHPAKAQTLSQNSNYIGGSGVLRVLELYDNEGNRIRMASEMGVQGTPLLQEGWGKGKIFYHSGETLLGKYINFSLYNHKLYYVQDKKMYEVVKPVDSFSVSFPHEDGTECTYFFRSGYPSVENRETDQFYEVLYQGSTLELVQWNHKKVRDVFNYGGSREKDYALDQQLYVYDPKGKTMTPLKAALPAIRKSLPGYATIINEYTATHKIGSLKDKREMIELMAYIDRHR